MPDAPLFAVVIFLLLLFVVVIAPAIVIASRNVGAKQPPNPAKRQALALLRTVQSELAEKCDLKVVNFKICFSVEVLQSMAARYADEIRPFARGKTPLAYLQEIDREIDMTEEGGVLAPHMKLARTVLTDTEAYALESVAVGIAPTMAFDACSCRGPLNERIIILNYGFMCGLDMGMRSMMTFHTQIFNHPIIYTDVSVIAEHWYESCLNMARQTVKIANPTAVFAGDYSELTVHQATELRLWIPGSQLFVLLHEFAHIILDHKLIDVKDIDSSNSTNLEQEKRADEWALERLLLLGVDKFDSHPMWFDSVTCGPLILLFIRQMYKDLFEMSDPKASVECPFLQRADRIVEMSKSVPSRAADLMKDLKILRDLWNKRRSRIRFDLGYPVDLDTKEA